MRYAINVFVNSGSGPNDFSWNNARAKVKCGTAKDAE